jgi:hypothetical protein
MSPRASRRLYDEATAAAIEQAAHAPQKLQKQMGLPGIPQCPGFKIPSMSANRSADLVLLQSMGEPL